MIAVRSSLRNEYGASFTCFKSARRILTYRALLILFLAVSQRHFRGSTSDTREGLVFP